MVVGGKLQDIALQVAEHDVDVVVFNHTLSPAQERNIEAAVCTRVLDRNGLILDIFAARARTSHARTQVELAQYEYLLPRLTKMWTHLQKQKGGIGMKGPGEREIETDRRIIRGRISKLKADLKKIDKQMATQRGNRGALVRVALIGYTNVGKSTMMNVLCKASVFAKNKLFSTLDTTVRKVVIGNLPFLLSDTVGFIRKLPTQLVESFKSTLDEVREADLLLHVLDVSHPAFEDHFHSVQKTIAELGASEKPMLLVFNKVDAFRPAEVDEFDLSESEDRSYSSLEELEKSWMAKSHENAVFISAAKKIQIDELRSTIFYLIKGIAADRYPNLSY